MTLHNLSIGYPVRRGEQKVIASGISLKLPAGKLVCLLGPNGAGKSTLMRTISGMQRPISGNVMLDGRNVHQLSSMELARNLSVVLTEKIDGGLLTSYEVVSQGRYPYTNWSGLLTSKDHDVISWAISATGAAGLAYRSIGELSDGERQRVMMARALAQEPKVMILDEITAFLDLPRRVDLMNLLRKMAHDTNRAILLSTHDLDLALRSSDLIWLLSRDGTVSAGAPEALVLDGTFERAFSSEGVEFNRSTGSFRIGEKEGTPVNITGTGEKYEWTRRALERLGYTVSPSRAVMLIEVNTNTTGTTWTITDSSGSRECFSLDQLEDHLSGPKTI